jgi:hypothetical protein
MKGSVAACIHIDLQDEWSWAPIDGWQPHCVSEICIRRAKS